MLVPHLIRKSRSSYLILIHTRIKSKIGMKTNFYFLFTIIVINRIFYEAYGIIDA